MLIYMAHPVRPVQGETLEQNIDEAKQWLMWLHEHMPAWHTIAPWLVEVELYGDGDETQRAASLERVCAAVRQCHGLVFVGRRISLGGMLREGREAWQSGASVYDLTWLYRDAMVELPPAGYRQPQDLTLAEFPGRWPRCLEVTR